MKQAKKQGALSACGCAGYAGGGVVKKLTKQLGEWAADRGPLSEVPLRDKRELIAAAIRDPKALDTENPELLVGGIYNPRSPRESAKVSPSFAKLIRDRGVGLRYELTESPKGMPPEFEVPDALRHYDLVGGRQAIDAIRARPVYDEAWREDSGGVADDYFRSGQFRLMDLEQLANSPTRKQLLEHDPFYDPSAGSYREREYQDLISLYANDAEGAGESAFLELSGDPRKDDQLLRKLLERGSLRNRYNISAAVPEAEPAHRHAIVKKADGGSIKPTPRSSVLGALADALKSGRSVANRVDLPVLGGLGDLFLGKAPEEVDEWSYGSSPFEISPLGDRLPRVKPGRKETFGDLAMTAPDALGLGVLAKSGAKAVGSKVKQGALTALRNASAPSERMALQGQRGAVRLKGGNFNEKRLNEYLGDTLGNGNTLSIHDWTQKQLRNYLRKDLGTPTDPLLAVEREYPDLHLPEGQFGPGEDQTMIDRMFNTPHQIARRAEATEALGPEVARRLYPSEYNRRIIQEHAAVAGDDVPLTPWGRFSSGTLNDQTPGQYAADLIDDPIASSDDAFARLDGLFETGKKHAWLKNAPPDTKIWGFADHFEDNLGFNHVLDYLEAATEPFSRTKQNEIDLPRLLRGEEPLHPYMPHDVDKWAALNNAGLLLDPASLSRLSVPDAVRKTAQWNEFLAKQGTDGDPDLARGIANVHKDYGPEGEGMKWVELGYDKDKLPEGWVQRHDALANEPEYIGPDGKVHTNHPGRDDLSAGLNAEGKAMGHCVGGYCDEVAERGTKIYSLRDAKGRPHVTVEVRPQALASAELDAVRAEVWPSFAEGPHHSAGDNLLAKYTEAARADEAVGALTPLEWGARQLGVPFPAKKQEIVQIKGKGNAAPVDKYLPFVQDFVKSGKWGRVGDARNARMTQIDRPVDIRGVGPDGTNVMLDAGLYTRDDIVKLLMERGALEGDAESYADRYTFGAGYAHGGSVQVQQQHDDAHAAGWTPDAFGKLVEEVEAMYASANA